MDIHALKMELKERGWSYGDLASKLAVSEGTIKQVLSGRNKMTETMSRHIELLLEKEREAVFVYKVNIPEEKVQELCGRMTCASEEDRQAAIAAIVHHNLAELVELGKQLDWTPEERKALGID